MIQYVLLDIEGTVSDIDFVHKVLFPYAKRNLPQFLLENQTNSSVKKSIQSVEDEFSILGLEAVIHQLGQLMDQDVKHPELKKIQGLIWKTGFESKEFQSHIYEDVLPNLKKWKEQGLKIGIYSSGSRVAQKLFFTHTEQGNLLDFFEDHFDLDVGGKKEIQSYLAICKQISISPNELLFLSDIDDELRAAGEAGCKAIRLIRPGTKPSGQFREVRSFDEVHFDHI